MPGLQVKIHVSPRAAILAGKTRVGPQSLDVTEADLGALTASLRLELALLYESGEVLGLDASEPPVGEPTLAAILPALELRAARRARREEAARAAAADRAEAEAAVARAVTERGNARSRALRAWVEKNGDEEMRARMSEGYLRDEEILEDICAEMLELPGYGPYDMLHRGHACDCACAGDVKFTECAPQNLDARQYSRLRTAREEAPEGAKVTVHEHRAACPSCKCVPIARLEVRLTMEWHGFELVRQYALI